MAIVFEAIGSWAIEAERREAEQALARFAGLVNQRAYAAAVSCLPDDAKFAAEVVNHGLQRLAICRGRDFRLSVEEVQLPEWGQPLREALSVGNDRREALDMWGVSPRHATTMALTLLALIQSFEPQRSMHNCYD